MEIPGTKRFIPKGFDLGTIVNGLADDVHLASAHVNDYCSQPKFHGKEIGSTRIHSYARNVKT